jgi:CubicO group peptidase (beta-lactamase class C family)
VIIQRALLAKYVRRGWRVGAVAVSLALATAACASNGTASGPDGSSAPGALAPAPPSQVPPLLTQQQVDGALGKLDGLVQDAQNRTAVPGIAVAVVYHDKVVYLKGFGVREVGKPDTVDADTVFQLASLSKPLASTVVAGVVGRKAIGWDDPVITTNPNFSLKDPYVTRNATLADLLSHRSGLLTGSGDLLEDLGFDRTYILSHLNQQPLDPFRSSYNYSNFGYTEGGQAAADAAKMSWEDLAQQMLFTPLNMTETSYRHSDYDKAPDKALLHVPVGNKTWAAMYNRQPDAEAPAGGASSSVRDLAQWVRLQLGNGSYDGKQVIDPDALATTHVPHAVSGLPATPAAGTHFYGLGWNVSYDEQGRLQLGHSGAFNLGAATSVLMLPGEQLGIVVLTNGRPQGIPEAIGAEFFDVARHGAPTVDWLSFTASLFQKLDESEKPKVDYFQGPAQPTPAHPDTAYTGTYNNSYYGPLTVAQNNGKLTMTMGPIGKPTTFALTHYTGDTFTFQSSGENGNGLAGAIFTSGDAGTASTVRLDFYDQTGLGTFTRD